MIKNILYIAIGVLAMISCSRNDIDLNGADEDVYVSRVECKAFHANTRAYDTDLNWSWETGDALRGYQLAGRNLRNTLSYVETASNFVCEAFQYMSTDPERFHFIYPAASEVVPGTLVAVQDGVWRPLSVTTVENATIESMPSLSFTILSAALELRIFDEDMQTPVAVTGAVLEAATDFVGKWTLNEDDMTYEQSYEGKRMAVNGEDWSHSVVVFNMPHYPNGVDAGFFTLTLTDANGGTMTRTLPALSFVKGKRTVLNIVYSEDMGEDPAGPDPDTPGEITGTFTCSTYNVDGLPEQILGFISLNGDGPASSGTTAISQKIAASGWDIVTFQENFSYNTELESAMKPLYTFGKHRSFSLLSALGTADTDGLGFAVLNSTCSYLNESMWAFEHKEGGLLDGANTSIKKGVRHYVVSFGNDVVVDVLVTHMNTAENDAQIAAQNGQLAEVAEYINSIRNNKRPIIFMGDMNTRYTRNDYKTYFWDILDSDLIVADPWVEHCWDGVYPVLGSASMMVPSKDAGSTLTEQTGEVVDKIIYINNPDAAVKIKSNWYLHDESYRGMADHKPVVAEFTYTKK